MQRTYAEEEVDLGTVRLGMYLRLAARATERAFFFLAIIVSMFM